MLNDQLGASAFSHEQLFATRRASDVPQLGDVRRVYLEACGNFSVFKAERPKPGLCILPQNDPAMVGPEAER